MHFTQGSLFLFTASHAHRNRAPLPSPPNLGGPDVEPLVEGATGKVLSVVAEGNRVHWVDMPTKSVQTRSLLHLPQLDSGVKRCSSNRAGREGGREREGDKIDRQRGGWGRGGESY